MNSRKFSEAMNEIDNKYIKEAISFRRGNVGNRSARMMGGVAAACLCLMIGGVLFFARSRNPAVPDPDPVQVSNPFLSVDTPEEMERYLDFDIPVLNKEIRSCSILVRDTYPVMGQIDYADGSQFRIQYGSGDISGIYGGEQEKQGEIEGVEVRYYRYEDLSYALWEQDGFAFSYVYTGDGSGEVETLIREFENL